MKFVSGFAFENRAFEEIRVALGPKAQRIGEDKFTKIRLRDEAVVDQFVGFLEHLVHVNHVEVADVGAEQSPEARTIGINVRIKCPRIYWNVNPYRARLRTLLDRKSTR